MSHALESSSRKNSHFLLTGRLIAIVLIDYVPDNLFSANAQVDSLVGSFVKRLTKVIS